MVEYPVDDFEYTNEEPECLICGGEGFIENPDPLWYDGTFIHCNSCGGSGLAKDMTYW